MSATDASPLDRAAARLARALDAAEDAVRAQTGPAGARREVELMAEDRARMAEELAEAKRQADATREAGEDAMTAVREARQAVSAALGDDA